MSNHSPEADYTPTTAYVRDSFIAERLRDQGIPDDRTEAVGREQDAWHRWVAEHDAALVAATHAQQYATTREALAKTFRETYHDEGAGTFSGHSVDAIGCSHCMYGIDALLATPGPLLDAGEVWTEGVEYGQNRAEAAFTNPLNAHPIANPYREARP